MDEPKIYLSKCYKNENGIFVTEEEIDIIERFKGVQYRKTNGLEAYGKPRTYTEKYPEESTADIFFGNTLETTDFTLTLCFFDSKNHENKEDAIKEVDTVYHSFVEYIIGGYLKYWDNIRKRKVILAYQEATNPSTDSLYGLIYKDVSFKFTNIYGKSFPLDSTELNKISKKSPKSLVSG